MTRETTTAALLALLSSTAEARRRPSLVRAGAPALADHSAAVVEGELWDRAALSRRDRSLVTVAALASVQSTAALRPQLDQALDHGLSPEELSEVLTQIGFYAGFPAGTASAALLGEVLDARGLSLAPAAGAPLALDPDREAARRAAVARVAPLAPGLAHYTDALLFGEVWRRPGLAPRDRSLATVAALIALGQAEQLPFHLERAVAHGLTPAEAGEVVAHLAFYCGWPRAFSALAPLGAVLSSTGVSTGPSGATDAPAATVTVTSRAEAPHFAGPADRFTGEVEVESLFHADLAGDNGGGMVHFQPGARTAWHTHPRGQTLIVTAGEGWVQQEGEPRHTIREGDVVRIPPAVRHWHGATSATAMSHVAIAESVDGSSVDWMELVAPEDAEGAAPAEGAGERSGG